MKNPCVYITASASRVLYTGVTSDLFKRVYEQKHGLRPGFTARYNVTRLVHFENFPRMESAIIREKQIKGWRRAKKVALIEAQNPGWSDLAEGWFGVAMAT
ncbi:MAG TPA: GIY-YIG nuclease family protein [Candidatus Latescibacteria bacterium]|nr:GIY-YIG nuclease family protein [Candidatus Latescibacterota bacterium]